MLFPPAAPGGAAIILGNAGRGGQVMAAGGFAINVGRAKQLLGGAGVGLNRLFAQAGQPQPGNNQNNNQGGGGGGGGGGNPARDANIPQAEVDAVRARWQQNPNDIGLVAYKPSTGEIHVANFDAHGGHDMLLRNLNIADANNWRGAIVSSNGNVINNSGLNVGRGFGQGMAPEEFAKVTESLRRVGLAP